MIISSDHHALSEEYKLAEEEHTAAIKALTEYTKTHKIDSHAMQLSNVMDETGMKAAKLKKKLDSLKIK